MKVNKKIISVGLFLAALFGVMFFKDYLFIDVGNSRMNRVYNHEKMMAHENDYCGINEGRIIVNEGKYSADLKFSGSLTVWSYESSKDEELVIPYTLDLISGKAKLVLISPDNSVVNLIENTEEEVDCGGETTIKISLKRGINRIKLIGYRKSEVQLYLWCDKGEFHKN